MLWPSQLKLLYLYYQEKCKSWLLQKKTNLQWGSEQQKAFANAKQSLTSDCLLVHYDPDKESILACDASPYGLGACYPTK